MATKSLHVPQAGYKKLEGGNHYISEFGFLAISGAVTVPATPSLPLFGRGLARSLNRGQR